MALIDMYRDSVTAFAAKVARVRPGQWDAATPCPGWDIRALVNHVVSEEKWSVPLFAGATVAAMGDRFDGDLLGDDPLHVAAAAAEDAKAAVSGPGAMQRSVHLSIGDTPAAEYVHQLFADHLVHGWDLAVATGTPSAIDPGAAAACLSWFRDREDWYRDGGAVGPRLELASDASAGAKLLAAFGRDPDLRM